MRHCVVMGNPQLAEFNSLPNDTFLDGSNSKAFADDKMNITYKQKIFFEWIENIAGKGENAGYQHFLLFPQCFHKKLFWSSMAG